MWLLTAGLSMRKPMREAQGAQGAVNVNLCEQGKDMMISCHGHLLRARLPVYMSSHYKPDTEVDAGNAILNQQRGDLREESGTDINQIINYIWNMSWKERTGYYKSNEQGP